MKLIGLKKLMEDPQVDFIVHNSQFEHKWLLSKGINAHIVEDTFLLMRLFDERLPAGLESACLRFGIDKGYKSDPTKLMGLALAERPTKDAFNTFELWQYLYPKLSEKEKQVYYSVLLPAAKTLAQIELEGVCVSKQATLDVAKELETRIADLHLETDQTIKDYEQARKAGGKKDYHFNVNSPQQKVEVVYDMLGYSPIAYTTNKDGKPSDNPASDAEVLTALLRLEHGEKKHEGALEECGVCHNTTLYKIVQASQMSGQREKFIGKLLGEVDAPSWQFDPKLELMVERAGKHYVHTDLTVYGARTGRLTSTNINLQNIVNNWVRKIFVPRHDLLLEGDYKGIELRIWACLAQDQKLIEAIRNGDPHLATAKDIYADPKLTKQDSDKRFVGKTFNYIIINGGGPSRLSLQTGLPVQTTEQMFKRFWKQHPTGRKFWVDWVEADEWDDYDRPKAGIVYSPTGMKRHFDKPTQARNHLIQNPALVAILGAANEAVPFVKGTGQGVVDLTVHDSLRLDIKKEFLKKHIYTLKDIMESQKIEWVDGEGNRQTLDLPFEVEFKVGPDWAHCEELKL